MSLMEFVSHTTLIEFASRAETLLMKPRSHIPLVEFMFFGTIHLDCGISVPRDNMCFSFQRNVTFGVHNGLKPISNGAPMGLVTRRAHPDTDVCKKHSKKVETHD